MNLKSSQKSSSLANLEIHILEVIINSGKWHIPWPANIYIQNTQININENIYKNVKVLSADHSQEESSITL